MHRAVIVRGTTVDPSHNALDEPVADIRGPVEVTVRPVHAPALGSPLMVLQALRDLTISKRAKWTSSIA